MNKRKSQGGTLPLVIATTLVIVIIGIFFFFLVQLIGGEREFQNAVDSGNLNVAKRALVKRTPLPGGLAGIQFAGLGPTDDTIDLNTFNRTSAITALVLSNTRAMQTAGVTTGSTAGNAAMVQSAWENVGTSLSGVLAQKSTFDSTNDFTNVANSNSVRMLTNKDNNSQHTTHDTSFSDRSTLGSNLTSSNVGFLASQFPSMPSSGAALFVPLSGQNYAKGYLNFNFGGPGSVFFVPLKQSQDLQRFRNSQPHHISDRTFATDRNTVPGWTTPVPNAFLSRAQSNTAEIQTKAQVFTDSCAIAQSLTPGLGFKAQIPRGFIRIKNFDPANPTGCSPGASSMPPTGSDIFSFLMNTNLFFGKPAGFTPLQRYYDLAPGSNLDAIIAKNAAGQDPNPVNCNALRPAAPMSDCKLIASKGGPITNSNVSPGELAYIQTVFNLVVPPGAGSIPVTGCLHAAERANQEFLAIRATGASTAILGPSVYSSGVARVVHGRGSFGGGCTNFTMTVPVKMSEVIPPGSAIYAQLVQRCRQINPEFNGNLDTVIGWNSLNVPLGATLFIFFDGTVNRNTGAITGNLRLAAAPPAFLPPAIANTPVDGRVLLHRIRTEPIDNFKDINKAGDCGYPLPYDFYEGTAAQMCVRDKIEYIPCTGFRGLLGEVDMSTCFGNNACPSVPTVTEGPGPASTDCRVDASAYWEGPC